jgi:hypothetical protein
MTLGIMTIDIMAHCITALTLTVVILCSIVQINSNKIFFNDCFEIKGQVRNFFFSENSFSKKQIFETNRKTLI